MENLSARQKIHSALTRLHRADRRPARATRAHLAPIIVQRHEPLFRPISQPMIAALTGQLIAVEESRVSLRAANFVFELLVPAADVESLRARIDAEITFHTIFYLEGQAGGGNLDPKLLGFLRPEDKAFFNLFTTVKGIGPKTALRAFSVPVGETAQAIESK